MKILVTEKQLRNILREEAMQNQKDIALAKQLMSDPNNEVVWRVYDKSRESSILNSGFSSEWFGSGEGGFHGWGCYVFYKPYGASERFRDSNGTSCNLGNALMKGVLLNGFKNCLIFDKRLALKYYHSDNFIDQLKTIYSDENVIRQMYQLYCNIGHGEAKRGIIPDTSIATTGYIAKSFHENFDVGRNHILRTGKCRGMVYNGSIDHYAAILYDQKEVIPIETRGGGVLPRGEFDFKDYNFVFTKDMFDRIQKFGDFYGYGERLKSMGVINDYIKEPIKNNCLKVILKNGRMSLYDIKKDELIYSNGFDKLIGWNNINGKNVFEVLLFGKVYYVIQRPDTSEYYLATVKKTLEPLMLMSDYDNGEMLNEEYDPTTKKFYVYHRTDTLENAESIMKYGISREYLGENGISYGEGTYGALTAKSSSEHLSYYGRYMIRCEVIGGLYGFIILNEELAKKVYGTSDITKQFDLLIPDELKPEIKKHYGENYKGLQNVNILHYPIINKTNIRGIICPGFGTTIIVCLDFKVYKPVCYSADNGRTWVGQNIDNTEFFNKFGDADNDMRSLIANGIVKKNKLGEMYTYLNGFAKVILTNGKISYFSQEHKILISMRGFDGGYGVTNINGEKLLGVKIDGKQYYIGYDKDDGYYLIGEIVKLVIIKKIKDLN